MAVRYYFAVLFYDNMISALKLCYTLWHELLQRGCRVQRVHYDTRKLSSNRYGLLLIAYALLDSLTSADSLTILYLFPEHLADFQLYFG